MPNTAFEGRHRASVDILVARRDRARVTRAFYEYEFTNGARTEPQLPVVHQIHGDRADAIFPHLDRLFLARWADVHCLDRACHEAWFSMHLAQRGAASVVGVDLRADHIEKARWIAEASGTDNVHFQRADLFAFAEQHTERYELVLCLGLLYHVENPMGMVRVARQFTKDVCVFEGLVARNATMAASKTGAAQPREGPGAIVLPSDPIHGHEPSGIAIIPSLPALHMMLDRAGFRAVHLVMPSGAASPMYQIYDRVILFAYA